MATAVQARAAGDTGARDPKELLDAVAPHIRELTTNVFDSGMTLWAIDGADCSPCDDKVPDSH